MAKDLFITEDFLLETDAARELYHNHAKDMPIVDYHCHLPPAEVAEDKVFDTITDVWLKGDHYKWRAMRSNGVAERYCTGDASDWEKFQKWAETMPYLLRNPLYHWTHMELKTPFAISDRLLNPETAKGIYDECNAKLAQPGFSARGLMQYFKVKLVCTTDDPVDSLEHHAKVAADADFSIQMRPTWRPDKAMAVESPEDFNAWVAALGKATDMEIHHFNAFLEAIRKRHDFFHEQGCRLSDHGLETLYAADYRTAEIEAAFAKIRRGENLDAEETEKFKSAMLYELAVMDHEKDWTQQFHLGAHRNNNTRMFESLGRDTGFDSMGDFLQARPLVRFLDRLDREEKLTRTVLYNLNAKDNHLLASVIGSFQDGSVPGKMQFGSAWWLLDHLDGMERQMEVLSQLGLLSRFIGMLTDSRSFLSYTRHDYFRRLLCNILGNDITKGRIPNDMALVGGMVEDISYNNVVGYLGIER